MDCHTHLTSCADPPLEVMARARAAGVQEIVPIGSSAEEMAAVAPLLDEPGIWTTAGLHPNSADDWSDAIEALVRARAAHPRCVAIGETGLDAFRDRAPRARQVEAFRAQLAIARELDMTVVIHCRDADEDCFRLLADEGPARVILHCFSVPQRLDEAIANGWWCSFAGNATYPKAHDLLHAAARCPADRILLETDAPYLTPVPHRGAPNEPAFVLHTLDAVARVRGQEPAELAAQVRANAGRAYALPL
ncbi:MAG: TatD family hydrolase [Actinomycetota bacterium]